MARSSVPLDQVQGNITPGFRKDFQDYLFLRFPDVRDGAQIDARTAQAWLGELMPSIASAEEVATFNRLYRLVKQRARSESYSATGAAVRRYARSTWVNVAFTAGGLIGLVGREPWTETHLDASAGLRAFVNGMCRRSGLTGDSACDLDGFSVRDSVSSSVGHAVTCPHGEGPGLTEDEQRRQVAHAVVIIGADDPWSLDLELIEQLKLAQKHGLVRLARFRGQTLGGGREHFGFRDGLSQPDPDDPLAGWFPDGEQVAAPGLFIRGCSAEKQEPDVPVWERYGSYLVLRRLNQDVDGFWQQMGGIAAGLTNGVIQGLHLLGNIEQNQDGGGNAAGAAGAPSSPTREEVLVAAKLVGRWPSGARLGPVDPNAATPTDPASARNDQRLGWSDGLLTASDFASDRLGATCPLFAHVRRAYPRVGAAEDGTTERSVRGHRIIRRGIPYQDGTGRGLLFACYQASIADGFEHIQHAWLNSAHFGHRGVTSSGQDPFSVIDHRVGQLQFRVSGGDGAPGETYVAAALTRSVKAEAGGYFFAPSIPALECMSSGDATS